MNALNNFCDKKSLSDNLRKAFITYCQSLYGSRYSIRDSGETIKMFLSRMTEAQLNDAWMNFIMDIKSVTPQEMTS